MPFLRLLVTKIPIPTILGGGLWAAYTGNFAAFDEASGGVFTGTEISIFEHAKYPGVFLFFSGLTIGWLAYQGIVVGYIGRRKRARLKLVELRDEGVALRKRGIHLTHEIDVTPWAGDIDDWHARAVHVIARIDEADAGLYRTIDYPGPPRAELSRYLNEQHMRSYAVLDRLLVRLAEFMTKHGTSNTTTNP